MDWYCYFKERFTWGSNPYASVEKCRHIVDALLSNPAIPSRIGIEAAVGFLAAARDFAGDGCFVSTDFASVADSLIGEIHDMAEETFAMDSSWAPGDGQDGPGYDPGEYTAWPEEDEWGEPPDDEGDGEEPYEAAYKRLKVTLDELYGSNGEAGTTGTRRPFPDWEHIDKWTQTDWMKLQTYKEKVLIAAGFDFSTMDRTTNALAAASGAMNRIPLPRQVELCMWSTELVDGLIFGLEDNLEKLCAGSLHSHQGRLVQKQLLNMTLGQAQNDP